MKMTPLEQIHTGSLVPLCYAPFEGHHVLRWPPDLPVTLPVEPPEQPDMEFHGRRVHVFFFGDTPDEPLRRWNTHMGWIE